MEILIEVLTGLIQLLAELVLQMAFEWLAGTGIRILKDPFRARRKFHPLLAVSGYLIAGASAGALSLLVFPESFIDSPWLKAAYLGCMPLLAGALMAMVGRRRRDGNLIGLDQFNYGFLFAFAMAVVRYVWAGT